MSNDIYFLNLMFKKYISLISKIITSNNFILILFYQVKNSPNAFPLSSKFAHWSVDEQAGDNKIVPRFLW